MFRWRNGQALNDPRFWTAGYESNIAPVSRNIKDIMLLLKLFDSGKFPGSRCDKMSSVGNVWRNCLKTNVCCIFLQFFCLFCFKCSRRRKLILILSTSSSQLLCHWGDLFQPLQFDFNFGKSWCSSNVFFKKVTGLTWQSADDWFWIDSKPSVSLEEVAGWVVPSVWRLITSLTLWSCSEISNYHPVQLVRVERITEELCIWHESLFRFFFLRPRHAVFAPSRLQLEKCVAARGAFTWRNLQFHKFFF